MPMMPTHALMGILLGIIVSFLTGENTVLLSLIGLSGGIFPDIDMVLNHRKTLHLPILYNIPLIILIPIVFLTQEIFIITTLSVFLLSCGFHCAIDYLGAGDTLRPWEDTTGETIYNHVTQEWVDGKKFFYDGSSVDLFLSSILFVLIILLSREKFLIIISTVFVIIGIVYTLLRRKIPKYFPNKDTMSEAIVDLIKSSIP